MMREDLSQVDWNQFDIQQANVCRVRGDFFDRTPPVLKRVIVIKPYRFDITDQAIEISPADWSHMKRIAGDTGVDMPPTAAADFMRELESFVQAAQKVLAMAKMGRGLAIHREKRE